VGKDPSVTSRQPLFMQRRSTDEYQPRGYSRADQRVVRHIASDLTGTSESSGTPARLVASGRVGTAIGLRALNDEWGAQYYDVPPEAANDARSAEEVFSGPETVVDIQTHFLPPGSAPEHNLLLDSVYRHVMPDWWKEMDPLVTRDIVEFVRAVFVETENAVAVLSTGPALSDDLRPRGLSTAEMGVVRALADGFGGTGRLLNHAIVHPERREELEAMEQWRHEFHPSGWKVYTMGHRQDDLVADWTGGYQLDDEERGLPFLQRARDLDVRLVCAHKGLSGLADNGSPRDIGPAARAFPELEFIVYHSGFEFPGGTPGNAANVAQGQAGAAGDEGPYTEALAGFGVNRLLRSLESEGLGRNCNVYAELGSTWFSLIRRPREAAHMLGKLIAYLGEDNVIWGADSVFYGPAQPIIDAFRVFQIPDDMCEEFGYSKLTPQAKAKILGENAARLYDIDLPRMRDVAATDTLTWGHQLVEQIQSAGFEPLH
jgi:uncharacterized protein